MRQVLAIVVATAACFSISCRSAAKALDRIPDDELAILVRDGASKLAAEAVKLAVAKAPASIDTIKKDGALIDQILRTTFIPAFSQAPLGTVLAGTASTLLGQLRSKAAGTTLDALVLASSVALMGVTLPPNPTEKLSPRVQGALAGLFSGLAEGIESSLGIAPPIPSPAPPPPAPASPPK